MVKSIKAIIIVVVLVSMTMILLSSCGQNNPLSAPHLPGGGITPGGPNAYTSGGPKPIRLPAWIDALPPASISCLLKQPNLNLNATSPNKKPFDQVCGPYKVAYAYQYHRPPYYIDSMGLFHMWCDLWKTVSLNGNIINSSIVGEYKGDNLTINLLPASYGYTVPCNDPCFLGGSFPEDAFTGNGAPPTRYLAGDGTIYDNMGSPPIPPASGPPKLIWVGISPDNASISVGQTASFVATGVYNPPPSEKDVTANIKSSNPAVATIANGLVTGISEGHVDLTVSLDGVMAWSYVDVVLGAPDSVVIEPASASMLIGDKYTFKAFAVYPGNKRVDVSSRYETTWSSDTAIATIAGGVVTAVASGSIPVSATFKGVTGTATVNVEVLPPFPDAIVINPPNASIAQGQTQAFTATAMYPNRSVDITNDPKTTWLSGRIDVAVIDFASKGVAKGKAPGVSNIAVAYDNKTYPFVPLTVTPPITTITITPNPAHLNNWGNSVSFTATATYSDSTIPPFDMTGGMTWSCNTYGIQSWGSRFTLNTYNNGTTTVSATSIVADRYSGKFLTASATLIYGDPNKNPCGLTYVPYDQTISPWGPKIYDTYAPNTIAAKGCLLTCYAMVFATKGLKINGKLVDPENLNQWLNDNNGYYSGGILDTYTGSVTNFSGVSSSTLDTDKLPNLDAALTNCRAAIVGVKSYVTGKQHYVLVIRKNGSDYDIIDPMYYRSTKLSDYIVTNTYSQKINQVISF